MYVNFLSVVNITAGLWPMLVGRPRAYVVGFGSIAAIRGRRRNVVYAAAKRALVSYFESLRHMSIGTEVRIHLYQLGYLKTQQTIGKRLLFPAASPDRLAEYVMDRIDLDHGSRFYPFFWRPVSLVIRSLPWGIFKRLDF
jgi:short-subunit dehydrogenase